MKKVLLLLLSTVLTVGCAATKTEKNARRDFYLNDWNDNKHFAIGQTETLIDDSEQSSGEARSVFGPLGSMLSSALGVVNTDDPAYQAKVAKFEQNTQAILAETLSSANIKFSEANTGKVLGTRSWIKTFFEFNPEVPYVITVQGSLTFNANKMMRKRKSAAILQKDFAVGYRWTIYNKEELELTVINTQHTGKVSGFLTYESEDFPQILAEYQKHNIEQLTKVLSDLWKYSNGKKNIDAYEL